MAKKKSAPDRSITFTAAQLRELKLAVEDRANKLRAEQVRLEGMGLDTDDIDTRINLLKGDDNNSGLAHLLSEQIDAFEMGFDAGAAASTPPPPPPPPDAPDKDAGTSEAE